MAKPTAAQQEMLIELRRLKSERFSILRRLDVIEPRIPRLIGDLEDSGCPVGAIADAGTRAWTDVYGSEVNGATDAR